MPVFVAPLVGFALGVGFAWAGAREPTQAHVAAIGVTRAWSLVGLFALLVFAPVTGYFLAYESDWAYAYFVDTERLSAGVNLAAIVFSAGSVLAGYAWASSAAYARRPSSWLRLGLIPLAVTATFLLLTLPRLAVRATFAQYHGDFGTRPVSESPLGYALLWMLSIFALSVVWTLRALARLGQRN